MKEAVFCAMFPHMDSSFFYPRAEVSWQAFSILNQRLTKLSAPHGRILLPITREWTCELANKRVQKGHCQGATATLP